MAKSLNPLLQIGRWLCLAPLVLAACTGSGGPGTTGSKADATAISVDAGLSERAPDALVADAVRAADTGPLATPDAAGNRDLPQPDAGAGDGTGQVFVPPMPSVGTDSTLMDMTDFGTSQGFKIILDYRYDTTQSMTRDKRLVSAHGCGFLGAVHCLGFRARARWHLHSRPGSGEHGCGRKQLHRDLSHR